MNDSAFAPLFARSQRRELGWFLLFAAVLIGVGIGLRDPWPADEPRFVLAARQMVESGNWLIPHRGSELYSDKPPLFMALQALGFELTRSWRIAFLLPSLLAALGTLWLSYDIARRLWNHRTGLYAAAALLFTFQFMYQAKRAQIDPTVTFFITLANYGLLRHLLLGPDWRRYWLGCFAAGLGVVTKGVGVLALALFLPYLYARWRRWQHLARIDGGAWRWAGGAVAFLAAVALWLVPMLLAVWLHDGPEFRAYANDILFHQTARRYADSWDHAQPWWYFLGVIASAWLPLTFAWIGAARGWWQGLKQHDARLLLPLAWVALVLLFFSFPSGKRDVYILPALPWMAVVSAPFLETILARRWFRTLALVLIVLLGALLLGGGLLAWGGHFKAASVMASQAELAHGGAALWGFAIAAGALALLGALGFRRRRGVPALLFGLTGLWLLWSVWATPLLNASSSAAGVMQHAGAIIGPDAELGMVAWKEQNLLLADRRATDFGFGQPWHRQLGAAIRWQAEQPQRRWIFLLADAMAPCIDPAKAVRAGHANRREWWLFRADAVQPQCRAGAVPPSTDEAKANPNDD